MLDALRKRQPGQPLWRILWWHLLHLVCFLWFAVMYRFRAWGGHNIPAEGPVLLVSNHQSFFDPIVVGLGSHHRQFCALARSGLFKNKLFGWLIRSLNAISVEQGASDTRAMRACVNVLKDGQALLVFPEGARTPTGQVQRFESGTMLLIKRARPTVVPVAISGAYAAWPRDRAAPRLRGAVGVMYGEPIAADRLLAMDSEAALDWLQQRVAGMQEELAQRLDQQRGRSALTAAPDEGDPLLD
jgi:1-acyl-sn-glycerol-3-phosphate acyltransferase